MYNIYAVRYTLIDNTVLVAFAKANSPEQARRLVYPQLMAMYEKFNIIEVEPTSMNVFVNPEASGIVFD